MSTPINTSYNQFNYFSYYREQLTRQAMEEEPEANQASGAPQTETAPSDEASKSQSENQPRSDFINFVQAFRKWAVLTEVLSGIDKDSAENKTEIDGGEGDDEIDADGINVSVQGGDGNDTINAQGYRVTVNGGNGDDTISASSAWSGNGPIFTSMISGDDGNDDITTTGLASLVNSGEGDDVITGKDGMMTIAYAGGDPDAHVANDVADDVADDTVADDFA